MWEIIQQRLVNVIQRPYQMFNIKDNTEEDEYVALEMDAIKNQLEKLRLQVELEIKEKELCKEQLKKMEKQPVDTSVPIQTEVLSTKERDFDRLVFVLQKIIEKGDISHKPEEENELDKDWEEICAMLDHYRELKNAENQGGKTDAQSSIQAEVVTVTEDNEEMQDDQGKEKTDMQNEEENSVSKEKLEQMGAAANTILKQIVDAYKDESTEEEK